MIDINECDNTPSPCEDVCTNTEGSYTCSCSSSSQYVTEDGSCTGNSPVAMVTPYVIVHDCDIQM